MNWTLQPFRSSIFLQKKCEEYVDEELLEGFIYDKMGISYDGIRRYIAVPFKAELDQITLYKRKWNKQTKSIHITYHLPKHKWGRILPNQHVSLSVFHRPTRHSFAEQYIDIDMINAHPSIFLTYAKAHSLNLPHLETYVSTTKQFRQEIATFYNTTISIAKELCLRLMFGGGFSEWFQDFNIEKTEKMEALRLLQIELRSLMEIVYTNNPMIKKEVLKLEPTKWPTEYKAKCGVFALWACTIERQIQETAILALNIRIEDVIPCQDGFMILKKHYTHDILDKLPKDYAWAVKPMDEAIPIRRMKCSRDLKAEAKELSLREALDKKQAELDENQSLFKIESDKFELNHCLIKDSGFYMYSHDNINEVKSEQQLRSSYKHITCGIDSAGVPINFFDKWVRNNDNIHAYQHIGCFPTNLPDNTFNTWTPFSMESIHDWIESDIQPLLNHIFILCNKDQAITDYFIKWLAQMIQYPEIKTKCPVLISKQGAGKGTILSIIKHMFGPKKVFETAEPMRDVWGSFNGKMNDCFLVNLNEISKKDVVECVGKFKQMVTDPSMTINTKGVNQFDIVSYHRFIITTNSEDPIPTDMQDRRNFIIRSSDELCGNIKYFEDLNKHIEDVNVIKSFYEYLKRIPDMHLFGSIVVPVSEYHEDLKEMSISPIQLWANDIFTFRDKTTASLTCTECYIDFNQWCKTNYPKYEVSNTKAFSIRLKHLNMKGITAYRTMSGRGYKFDYNVMFDVMT